MEKYPTVTMTNFVANIAAQCGNQKCATWLTRRERMKCGECLCTFYCNTECQRADWSIHKKKCKRVENEYKPIHDALHYLAGRLEKPITMTYRSHLETVGCPAALFIDYGNTKTIANHCINFFCTTYEDIRVLYSKKQWKNIQHTLNQDENAILFGLVYNMRIMYSCVVCYTCVENEDNNNNTVTKEQ